MSYANILSEFLENPIIFTLSTGKIPICHMSHRCAATLRVGYKQVEKRFHFTSLRREAEKSDTTSCERSDMLKHFVQPRKNKGQQTYENVAESIAGSTACNTYYYTLM